MSADLLPIRYDPGPALPEVLLIGTIWTGTLHEKLWYDDCSWPGVVMRKTLLATLIGSSFLITESIPRSALAETMSQSALPVTVGPPPAAPATAFAPATPARQWYGTPIVVTDIAAVTSLLLALQLAGDSAETAVGLAVAGVGAYAFGGPIVHFTEGRTAAGFGSLGLRVGAPLVGGLLGGAVGAAASQGCEGDWCGFGYVAGGGLIGFGVGVVTAVVVDYAELAYKPTKVPQLALAVTPTYSPNTGGAGLAVSGRW